MNHRILQNEVQEYILDYKGSDPLSLLLKPPIYKHIHNREIVEQLEARAKCRKKLPSWFSTPGIYYPNKLNIAQSSSEITARCKAGLVTGGSLVDLTGGFGVDSFFFAKQVSQVVHCEIDDRLSQIAQHNFEVLGVDNIKCIPKDGIFFLGDFPTLDALTENANPKDSNLGNSSTKNGNTVDGMAEDTIAEDTQIPLDQKRFDWIYLDPSRRHEVKGKVFRLSDAIPNVTEHLELLFSRADNILVKTAPLLDISMGRSELEQVKEIHVVAVQNEVKEVLWVLQRGYADGPTIKTVDFIRGSFSGSKIHHLNFKPSEETEAEPSYSPPMSYLYEPNAAILKAGAFKTVGNKFGLRKLHEHTHLYTSDEVIAFPGRSFRIEKSVPYSKKNIKRLGLEKANITTRNFPERVAQIRKKFNIGDGGDRYLFFVTDHQNDKIVLACSKIGTP